MLLLFTIFGLSFFFRVAVIFHNEYPPSSDIGLHSSIINLILDEGRLPLKNSYHMGGEPLATPPGFHFFTSTLILFTGMPLLFAQLLTAAFFSSFIVFPAYLIAKKIWGSHSAGFLAAYFAAVSALSFEMISWGGYTNMVSLAIMVIIFYLFFKNINQPSNFNLLMGTILFSSIILTHTFSLFVFFPILIFYFVSLLIGKVLKLKKIEFLKTLRFFTISVALGILFVSPWLLRVFNFYIGASSEGALLGGMEANRNLILQNRSVDSIILALAIVTIPAFFLFKASRKRYVDTGSLLLVAWFLVPVIMTQAHIFGVFVDYSRFLYFIDFPGILIISGTLFYIFRYTSISLKKFSRIRWSRIKRVVPAIFAAALFIFIILSPWSVFPQDAQERADWYTTIQRPEAIALEWIQNRTPESSILVADHLYGWWLSGVGKRTTLSAAGLEFLLYSHEIEIARSARFLLDTDYYIDNGLIQVREDGPYIPRHNPLFSIETWSKESYPLFYFDDNATELRYYQINNYGQREYNNCTLWEMKMAETSIILENENSTILTITRENNLFKINKTLTIHRGVRFVELSYEMKTKNIRTNLYQVFFKIYTQQGNVTRDLDIPMFGFYDPFQKVIGEMIFRENYPAEIEPRLNPRRVEVLYRSSWDPYIRIKILVAVFDAEDLNYPDEVIETYYSLSSEELESVTSDPLIMWNYHEMIERYKISFIVCRDYSVFPKFYKDPQFRFVFKGGNIAVFQVTK